MTATMFDGIPGGDLIEQGLADLHAGKISEFSLLVLVASPRLRALRVTIPQFPVCPQSYEHELYSFLERRLGSGAYSHYNALIRRIVSFERTLERLDGEDRRL